jgi:hypothetical protein
MFKTRDEVLILVWILRCASEISFETSDIFHTYTRTVAFSWGKAGAGAISSSSSSSSKEIK